MIKRLCPRCRKVIDDEQKYCINCMPKIRTEADKRYDRFKRNQESKSFYNSKSWRLKRAEVLSMYYNLDIYELYINKKIVTADTVHHINELIESPEQALDEDNLIPLSGSTHDIVHGMYKDDKITTKKLLVALKERWKVEVNGEVGVKYSEARIVQFKIGDVTYTI